MDVQTFSVARLLEEWDCDPFQYPPWWGEGVDPTREAVRAALETGDWARGSLAWSSIQERSRRLAYNHSHRIAFLVHQGWNAPIELDLGCPSLGYESAFPIADGCHRFAAALYLGHAGIRGVADGETDWIETFLYLEGTCTEGG